MRREESVMSNDQPDDFEWIAFIAKLEAAEEEFAQAPRRIQRFVGPR